MTYKIELEKEIAEFEKARERMKATSPGDGGYCIEFVRIEERKQIGKDGTNARYYFGDELDMLTCSTCGELKDVADMATNKKSKDDVMHRCKECHNKIVKKYRRDNLEKRKEYDRKYRRTIDGTLSNSITDANYKAKEFGQSEIITLKDVKGRYEAQAGKCIYCLEHFEGLGRGGLTIDHVISFSTGGRNVPGNIAFACSSCNRSKSNRDLHEWLTEKFSPAHITDSLIFLGHIGVNTLI